MRKAPALEAEQIDAGDRDIAAQLAGRHGRIAAEQGGNDGQVFPLDQRDLPRIAWPGAAVIAGQAGLTPRFHGLDFEHRLARPGAHAYPAHLADLRHVGEQFLQGAHRPIPMSNSRLRPRFCLRKSGASG